MAQFLFIVRPARPEMLADGPTEAEMAVIGQHFDYWLQLVDQKIALVVGRTQTSGPDTFGLAIFQAEDAEIAETISKNDPAVKGGVFTVEVFPYYVALLGDPTPFRP